MVVGPVRLGSDEHSWGWSIVEAVGIVADRDVRWNGLVVVHEDGFTQGRDVGVSALHAPKSPLIMQERHAEAIVAAYDRRAAREPFAKDLSSPEEIQKRWSELVEATGFAASRTIRLTAPMPDLTDSKAYPEVVFDEGLGDVWITPQRLAAVWRESDSAQLTIFDDVPTPSFSYAGTEPAASAARDVIAEIARRQGREPSPEDFAVISDDLLRLPPDRRWDAVIDMASALHGTQSSGMARHRVVETLRKDFLAAVEQGNPGSGTPDSAVARAVRAATADPLTREAPIDPRLSAMTRDPALSPAGGAVRGTNGEAGRPVPTGQAGRADRATTPGLGG